MNNVCPIDVVRVQSSILKEDTHECKECAVPVTAVNIEPHHGDDAVWSLSICTETGLAKREQKFIACDSFAPCDAVRVDCKMGAAADGEILALYQHKEWWMRPAWCSTTAHIPFGTQLLLWRRKDHDGSVWWNAVLVICDADFRTDIRGDAQGIEFVVSSNRMGMTHIAATLGFMSVAATPYLAVQACVSAAAGHTGISTRRQKPFPENLSGLGWCTWDSLGQNVNERNIIEKMQEFHKLGVPISWVLIDDGWSDVDRSRQKLRSFDADSERFPQGLRHTVDVLRKQFGVEHVGVWQAFQGYWNGIDPDGPIASTLGDCLARRRDGVLVPGPMRNQAARFWGDWESALEKQGVDFLKVDSQGSIAVMTMGQESFGEATIGRHQGLEDASNCMGGTIINCMAMTPENFWHSERAQVIRTSDDFLPRSPESLDEHIIQNAYCSLLLGQLYYPDWDMFWSEHPYAWASALARVFSGGPVYCSDALGHTNASVLRSIVGDDGKVLHPDSPGVPVEQSLLNDPRLSDTPLGIRAPFGDREMTLYIGLRKQDEQHVRLVADAPVMVYGPAEGAVSRLCESQHADFRLAYGQALLVDMPRQHAEGVIAG